MLKTFTLLALSFILSAGLIGQVTVDDFPEHLQLYPRDLTTNQGTVVSSGLVDNAGVSFTEMRLKVYRNHVLQTTETAALTYGAGTAPFSFSYDIPAELANYKFELYGFDGAETFIQEADSVVAGDAYVIQGQSNAVAEMRDGSANGNKSPYIRVFGRGFYFSATNIDWHLGQGDGKRNSHGNTGQWGLKFAREIIDNQNIPVAIFNGGHDGQPISFFQRNDADPTDVGTNYGKLLNRTQRAGLDQHIRGFFWFQGESDVSDHRTTNYYKGQFGTLISDWETDYQVSNYYMVQIRDFAFVTADQAFEIQEAQRQLADSVSKMEVISTSTLQHHTDDTHFPFTNGYEELGETAYQVVSRDCYGAADDNVSSPSVVSAALSGSAELSLYVLKTSDILSADAGVQAYFTLEGTSETVTGVIISGSQIILQLSDIPTGLTGISYSTPEGATESITNTNGIGLVAFHEFSIGTFPIELLTFEGEVIQSGIALNWETATETNNNYFEIEKSVDGMFWKGIGEVTGAGNSQAALSYQFVDRTPFNGKNFYRLKQVDFDGTFSYSPVISIELSAEDLIPSVFPNPSQGRFQINLSYLDIAPTKVQIFNTMGQLVASSIATPNSNGILNIDLSNQLKPGNYLLKLHPRKGYPVVTKILITR